MSKNEEHDLDWYKQEIAKSEKELEVLRHREERLKNRSRHVRSAADRVRTHRLIQYGAAFEGKHPELSVLTIEEIYRMLDTIIADPGTVKTIREAVSSHSSPESRMREGE